METAGVPKLRVDKSYTMRKTDENHVLLRRGSQWLIRGGLRALIRIYVLLLHVARLMGRAKHSVKGGEFDILLTGTFYAENWVTAHLRPLRMSSYCSRIRIVSTFPLPSLRNVEVLYPPAWLSRLLGAVPSRLLVFVWEGLRRPPDVIGGFHLLFNGLTAALLGRLIGSQTIYFCVGGATETLHGGRSENRLFGLLEKPDEVIKGLLIRAVGNFDNIVVMGSHAATYFRQEGIRAPCHIIPGGIDSSRFFPSILPPVTDMILIARLSLVKRVDVFLKVLKLVIEKIPTASATIVGDGPLRQPLEQLAHDLGVKQNVTFVGYQKQVETWLRRAKVFVLTSSSEGLSLAMIEAMMCGLPVVVPRVGDLGDLVKDDHNGYLVSVDSPETFADRITELLSNGQRYEEFSRRARQSASGYTCEAISRLWNKALTGPTLNT